LSDSVDPCPQVTTLLAEVEKLVSEAEKLGYEVLRVKRQFMELIEALGESKDKANADLEALSPDAARCAVAGLNEVAREIKAASDLGFELDTILDKGKDPDRFKAVHAKFVEQVEKAKAAVQSGLEELERRERERAERNQIDSELGEALGKISETIRFMAKFVVTPEGFEKYMGELNANRSRLAKLQSDADSMPIEDLRSQAGALTTECTTHTETVSSAVKAASDAQAEKFEGVKDFWKKRESRASTSMSSSPSTK